MTDGGSFDPKRTGTRLAVVGVIIVIASQAAIVAGSEAHLLASLGGLPAGFVCVVAGLWQRSHGKV
jgi:hypothetical protein